jgi:hypothetical protein
MDLISKGVRCHRVIDERCWLYTTEEPASNNRFEDRAAGARTLMLHLVHAEAIPRTAGEVLARGISDSQFVAMPGSAMNL